MEKKNSIEISTFKDLLKHNHYSSAFILYLLAKLQRITSVTFQQINELLQNQSSLLIQYFTHNPDQLHLLENKNPLCLQTIRDFMNKVFRGVYKKYAKNVNQFKQGLKVQCQNLIKIIISSTQQVADNAFLFLLQKNYINILVFNYSKSIAITLKKLSKFIGANIYVTICQCGITSQGEKLFQELSIENVNCRLINDTEINYYVKEVDCILTGAQVVLQNGSILNRVGTQMLALCAQQTHKPFIVMSQSYKFLKKTYLTRQDIPNFYRQEQREKSILVDLVDRKYINFLCTDIGLLSPEAVTYKMASIIN